MFDAGSVIAHLKADLADFQKGINSAKDLGTGMANSLKSNFGAAQDASKKFTVALAAGVAAGAAAVTAFATKAVLDYSKVGDEIQKMAIRTGLSAKEVSALRVAADMGGTSIDAVEASIKKMQLAMNGADETGIKLQDNFKKIGLTIDDEISKKDPAGQFEALGNMIASIQDPAKRTQAAIAAFGKAGAELIPMFEDGKFSMQEWTEQADMMGVLMDDKAANSAAELNDALAELKGSFSGISMTLAQELTPILLPIIYHVSEAIQGFTAWMQAIGGVTGALHEIQGYLEDHAFAVTVIAGAIMGAMVPAFIAWGTTLMTVTIPAIVASLVALAPYIAIGAAIAAVAYAIYYAWTNNFLGIREFLEPWIAWAVALFDQINAVVQAHGGWLNLIPAAWQIVVQKVKDFMEVLKLNILAWVQIVQLTWNTFWQNISNFFAAMNITITLAVQGFFTGLQTIFDTGVGFLKGAWEGFMYGIQAVATSIWEGVKNVFRDGINWIIDKMNSFISGLSAVTGAVGKAIGQKNWSIPSIPHLAAGGIVAHRPGGIIANIGEGQYDEAIVPLDGKSMMGGFHVHLHDSVISSVEGATELLDAAINRVAPRIGV